MTDKQDEKKRARLLADRPAPTEKQAGNMAAASERVTAKRQDRSRPAAPHTKVGYIGPNRVLVASPHTDDVGWAAQMADALGTADGRVVDMIQSAASRATSVKTVNSQGEADRHGAEAEQVLAFIAENAPTNPVEASLLMQMAAVQQVSMAMVAGVLQTDRRDAQADYVRLMNQTMRTFSAQAETLHKLRTGGKQQVEVRYVYVDARTQTLVTGGAGQGGGLPFVEQPHAPGAVGLAFAPGLPMRSEDPSGNTMPVARDPGAEALPDARGPQPRRTTRRGERELRRGPVDGGDHQGQGERSGARAVVS